MSRLVTVSYRYDIVSSERRRGRRTIRTINNSGLRMSSMDPFLAPEVLLGHLQTITILESMFPSEMTLPTSFNVLSDLAPSLESMDFVLPPSTLLPTDLRTTLSLDIGVSSTPSDLIDLEMIFPLRRSSELPPSSSPPRPPARIILKPPTFLSRSQHAQLCTSPLLELPPEGSEEDDFVDRLLLFVDHLRETIPTLASENERQKAQQGSSSTQGSEFDDKELDRVWFWLPSLSTKEKRNDIVRMAPSWNLTGFVLAGKPGILCLEGNSKAIDSYMGWIKSVSWSDIPAFQSTFFLWASFTVSILLARDTEPDEEDSMGRLHTLFFLQRPSSLSSSCFTEKITERHRTPRITDRLFQNMIEITDLIDHRGYHGNRGEMGQVRKWIEDRGVGADVLGKVLNLG